MPAPRKCAIQGCGQVAWKGMRHCPDCMDALYEWHRLHDGRESRARMAFFHACSAVRRWLWIPLTLGVIAGLVVMGSAWAPAVCEWMVDGGLLP